MHSPDPASSNLPCSCNYSDSLSPGGLGFTLRPASSQPSTLCPAVIITAGVIAPRQVGRLPLDTQPLCQRSIDLVPLNGTELSQVFTQRHGQQRLGTRLLRADLSQLGCHCTAFSSSCVCSAMPVKHGAVCSGQSNGNAPPEKHDAAAFAPPGVRCGERLPQQPLRRWRHCSRRCSSAPGGQLLPLEQAYAATARHLE